jgi:hypothetical protein
VHLHLQLVVMLLLTLLAAGSAACRLTCLSQELVHLLLRVMLLLTLLAAGSVWHLCLQLVCRLTLDSAYQQH